MPDRAEYPQTPSQTVGPFFGYALPYGGGPEAARQAYVADLAAVRAAVKAIPDPGELVTHKEKVWRVGGPDGIDRDAVYKWLFEAGKLVPGAGG